ncbi:MAG: hypothetical protein GY938_13105 [Ketobacter sp.]|nr:hypothetical protein [Ketobacter sp.]
MHRLYKADVYHCRACKVRLYISDKPSEFSSYQIAEDAPDLILADKEIPNVQESFGFVVNDLGDRTRAHGFGYALTLLFAELQRQEQMWGSPTHGLEAWHLILAEETGEVANAILEWRSYTEQDLSGPTNEHGERHGTDQKVTNIISELAQVASVSVQAIAHIQNQRRSNQAVRPARVPEPIGLPPVVDKILDRAGEFLSEVNQALNGVITEKHGKETEKGQESKGQERRPARSGD